MRPLPVKVFEENMFRPSATQTLANGFVIFISICVLLYFGQEILIPIVLAVLLAFLLAPATRMLQKWGINKSISIISVVTFAFLILFGITAAVTTTLTSLAGNLPQYEINLRQKAHSLKIATSGGNTIEKAANVLKDLQTELKPEDSNSRTSTTVVKPIPVEVQQSSFGIFDPVIAVVSMLIHPMTQIGIVILMVVLILFNKEDLRNRLIRLAGTGDLNRTTLALDEAATRLSALFSAQLTINSITGLFIGVALAFIGIPGAVLWGVLTTIFRFVPYVGTLLASVFPIIIAAAIGDGWTMALVTAGIILCTEIFVGQIVEPLFFGKMTGLSPVAIIASSAFWAAIWGPVGLVLATPITIGLLVVGRNIESLNFLDVLLGSEPVLTPDHAFYQRLLAADPIEAVELADGYISENRFDSFLNEVAIPGLLLAQRDVTRGSLRKERQTAIATTFSEMLDESIDEKTISAEGQTKIMLLSAHGALNFAATLAFSALLTLKNIPHQMLPQIAISNGQYPQDEASSYEEICICYLEAPSLAKHNYILKRVNSFAKNTKVISMAWSNPENQPQILKPEDIVANLEIESARESATKNGGMIEPTVLNSKATTSIALTEDEQRR
jgi:predicted PurR-regulated permease PerM